MDERNRMTAQDDFRNQLVAVNAGIGVAVRATDILDESQIAAALNDMQYHLDGAKALVSSLPFAAAPLGIQLPDDGVLRYTFAEGETVDEEFHISGGVAPYRINVSGNVPAGLTVTSEGHLAGVVGSAAGEFLVNLQVLDSASSFVTATIDITVT